MLILRATRLLVCVAFVAVAVLPAAAWAHSLYTYEGYDTSYNTADHYSAGICDGETDSRGAYNNFHVNYASGNPYRVDDANGSQSGCSQSGPFYSGIVKHHACESIPDQADPCAPYRSVY
jgi:hypothetical protein